MSLKNCLVLVFTAEDLAALPNCVRWLKTQNPERVLFLATPNIGITGAELTREHDAKIAQLESEKKQAIAVENFDLAKSKRSEIESATMDRDMAVRDGWKKVPEGERQAIYKKALAGLGAEPVMLRESYTASEAFTMLNGFRAQWPSDIPMDEFTLVWPQSVGKVETAAERIQKWDSHQPHAPLEKAIITPAQAQKEGIVADADYAKKFENPFTVEDHRKLRESELRKSRYMGIRSAALKHGIGPGTMEQMLAAILEKEFPPVVA